MHSSATLYRHPRQRETAANRTPAGCAQKFPSCCNRAPLLPPHIPHSALRTPQCCQAHPVWILDNRVHRQLPLRIPEMDLLPILRPCVPIAHRARYQPSERTSTECRPPMPPSPPLATLSPQSKDPTSTPAQAGSETPS